ncbi:C6 zinc finger domain protein [Penicillium angulare]|uniref:C6 zinc finger domain protein n=1 Tax=Penicillium angulare TaxID=116970 RepID=A0A9W9FW64_9EURO|nr:C6 zinc finger domain protein [Penicillium angulare]
MLNTSSQPISPSPEDRPVKRPRMALSCLRCRRRKVRCGKEQPQCRRCELASKACVYSTGVRDPDTGRVIPSMDNDHSNSTSDIGPTQSDTDSQRGATDMQEMNSQDLVTENDHPNQLSSEYPIQSLWHSERSDIEMRETEAPGLSIENGHSSPSATMGLTQSDAQLGILATEIQEIDPYGFSIEDDHSNRTANIEPTQSDTQSGGRAMEMQKTDRPAESDLQLSPSFRNFQQGPRQRFVASTFWAAVNGQEELIKSIIGFDQQDPDGLPPSYVSSITLAMLVRDLPTQQECDELIKYYFMAVHPIYPLITMLRFIPRYMSFWESFKGNIQPTRPTSLIRDPTFICTMAAILYVGALVATDSFWKSSALHEMDQVQTIGQLKDTCAQSLVACRHTEHPTLNTLFASILQFHFTEQAPLESATFVASTLRLAQAMGLGRHKPQFALQIDSDLIWGHLIWLDVHTSLSAGLSPCLGGAINDIDSLGLANDPNFPIDIGLNLISARNSIQCLVVKLQSSLMYHTQIEQHVKIPFLTQQIALIKLTCKSINQLINLIPVHGVPEKGMIPFRLSHANLEDNIVFFESKNLHDFWDKEPSIEGTWTRMMLSLLKLELVISYQKMLLPSPDEVSPFSSLCWRSITKLSLNYLQIFSRLIQTPAFQSYFWFHSNYYCPQQCALLIAIFLKNNPEIEPNQKVEMEYYVHELVDFCDSHDFRKPPSGDSQESQETELERPKSLRIIIELLNGLRSDSLTEPECIHPLHLRYCSENDAINELFELSTWLEYLTLQPEIRWRVSDNVPS